MAELVPTIDAQPPAALTGLLFGTPDMSVLDRARAFTAQPAVRRALPFFIGMSALGTAALAWSVLAPSPQRTLYAQLDDSDRASVVSSLDQAGIRYRIDNSTGALTVDEDDFYKARMLVASHGGIATPESGSDMLDNMPMGASRTLEGERLRIARERDLMLTIREIDGVESVRVHLAEGEKSVFVRDNLPPSASVMLRLARGRQLSDEQVNAIVNLVAGSVPGLSPDAVRVVDQHGRLLSQTATKGDDRLELQSRMEDKLRAQLAQLLTPMLGEGNFTTQIQVELNMDDVTSARETYDKDGAVRTETQESSTQPAQAPAGGVPGQLSNTPPPATQAVPKPPQGGAPQPAPGQPSPSAQPVGDSSSSRTYALGREVSVANSAPGSLKRLSVAVALSQKAMKGTKPADLDQIRQLVSAAVGADAKRGDQVTVMTRAFEPDSDDATPFYEMPWFAMVVRYGAAIFGLLLFLLLGMRPLIKAFRRDEREAANDDDETPVDLLTGEPVPGGSAAQSIRHTIDRRMLDEKVDLARRLVAEKPDSAVMALRQMLSDASGDGAEEAKVAG